MEEGSITENSEADGADLGQEPSEEFGRPGSASDGRKSRMAKRLHSTLKETSPVGENRLRSAGSIKKLKINRENMKEWKIATEDDELGGRKLRKRKDVREDPEFLGPTKKTREVSPLRRCRSQSVELEISGPRKSRKANHSPVEEPKAGKRYRSQSVGPRSVRAPSRRSERAMSFSKTDDFIVTPRSKKSLAAYDRRNEVSTPHVDIAPDLPAPTTGNVAPASNNLPESDPPSEKDFCWQCHRPDSSLNCTTCPRVFHAKCVSLQNDPTEWICPECSTVMYHESVVTRPETMKNVSLDQLCSLLQFTLERMKNVPQSEPFWKAVEDLEYKDAYAKFIKNPMHLELLERNIAAKRYGSTQAFLADAKWIEHNSIVFNKKKSPLSRIAKGIMRVCKQELEEIDNCPDCYRNAHTENDWFLHVCKKPHLLIWARLKPHPYWPAKAMNFNAKEQKIDSRFFGAHDKSNIPVKDCYLLSPNCPASSARKRAADLEAALVELDEHIERLKEVHGEFSFAEDKAPVDLNLWDKYLDDMLPGWRGKAKQTKRKKAEKKKKRRSTYMEEDAVVAEERVPNDNPSPEDEVMRNLEFMATPVNDLRESDATTEVSTDIDDCSEGAPIPEHGYTKSGGSSTDNTVNCTSSSESSVQEKETTESQAPAGNETLILIDSPVDAKEDKARTESQGCIEVDTHENNIAVESQDCREKDVEKDLTTIEKLQDNVRTPEECNGLTEVEVAAVKEIRSAIGEMVKAVEKSEKSHTEEKDGKMNAGVTNLNSNIENKKKKRKHKAVTGIQHTETAKKKPKESQKALPETFPKTDASAFLEVEVKQEDFEQYLEEENQEEIDQETDFQNGIKVLDLASMSSPNDSGPQLISKRPNKGANASNSKKENGLRDVNAKLRLSDEVSLHVVEGEKRLLNQKEVIVTEQKVLKKPVSKVVRKTPHPGPVTISTCSNDITVKNPSKNLNVISVDTKNSDAQKILLKSLCLEEKKKKDGGKKEKLPQKSGISPAASTSSTSNIQSLNGPIYIAQNGTTMFTTNPIGQNLALAQNGLGQVNLVHLTNLTSGIPTNYINVTNEALGFNNQVNSVYNGPPPLTLSAGNNGQMLVNPVATGKKSPPKGPFISVKNPALMGVTSGSASPPLGSMENPENVPGTVSFELKRQAAMVTEHVNQALISVLNNLGKEGLTMARVKYLMQEQERIVFKYEQQIANLRKEKAQLEAEKLKALNEQRQQMDKVIAETKRKQWCAHCGNEALFYCCWNTSYCDYLCQQEHWRGHMGSCAQIGNHSSPTTGPVRQRPAAVITRAPVDNGAMMRQRVGVRAPPNVHVGSFSGMAITSYHGSAVSASSYNGRAPSSETYRSEERLISRHRSNVSR